MTILLSTIWENTDDCAEQYICASAMYLMSVMSHCYCIIIDRGISAPEHGKEVVGGLNAFDKRYMFNFLGQLYLIHKLKRTLAPKNKM